MSELKNVEFAKQNLLFQKACELAGIQPTTRQASKWRNEKGKAFTFRHDAKSKLEPVDK